MPDPSPVPMTLSYRHEDGARLASLLWRFGPGWRMISSAVLGGGIGPREWVLNAQVASGYARLDPADHLRELGPDGPGVGMMTVAYADRYTRAHDDGVEAVATVGLRRPTWAAAPPGAPDPELEPLGDLIPHVRPNVSGGPSVDGAANGGGEPRARGAVGPSGEPGRPGDPIPRGKGNAGGGPIPRGAPGPYGVSNESGGPGGAEGMRAEPDGRGGPRPGDRPDPHDGPNPETGRGSGGGAPVPGTINILVVVPVAMSDAALVNAVMTVTEAKTQALAETGFPGTGTASDAVCVAVPQDGPEEMFGGPRSEWGARIARAVHAAVLDGVHRWHRSPYPG